MTSSGNKVIDDCNSVRTTTLTTMMTARTGNDLDNDGAAAKGNDDDGECATGNDNNNNGNGATGDKVDDDGNSDSATGDRMRR